MTMRNFTILALFVLSLACYGMGCLKLPPPAAAKQNLDNWELLAPAHKKYLDADEGLSTDGKRIRKRTVDDAVSLARKLTGEKKND